MSLLGGVHHIAVICSDYERSKDFYTRVLGLGIIKETYRKEKQSYKLDLSLNSIYCLELFSFPNPPERISHPEACGLRHIAFKVTNIEKQIEVLSLKGISCERVRVDEITGKKFTFLSDPDGLPIELYES